MFLCGGFFMGKVRGSLWRLNSLPAIWKVGVLVWFGFWQGLIIQL